MSRPYSRTCKDCSKKFVCRSNGRSYCYTCSPLRQATRVEDDKPPIGPDLPGPINGPDGELGRMAMELETEDQTTEVCMTQRPRGGWGQCQHQNPNKPKEKCESERWSNRTPFCKPHVKYWYEIREANRTRRMIEDEVGTLANFQLKNFKFKTAQEAADFLAQLNFAVYRDQMKVSKAKALKEIVMAQVAAINSGLNAKKIEALLREKEGQSGGLPDLDEGDLEADKELAERLRLAEDPQKPKSQTG